MTHSIKLDPLTDEVISQKALAQGITVSEYLAVLARQDAFDSSREEFARYIVPIHYAGGLIGLVRVPSTISDDETDYPFVPYWSRNFELFLQALNGSASLRVLLLYDSLAATAALVKLDERTIRLKRIDVPAREMLYTFIKLGRIQDIVAYFDRGGDIDVIVSNGSTALMEAINSGQTEVVRLLIDRGADVDLGNDRMWTPLHVAAAHGNEAILNLLLEAGANPLVRDRSGETPRMAAEREGHSAVIAVLAAAESGRAG